MDAAWSRDTRRGTQFPSLCSFFISTWTTQARSGVWLWNRSHSVISDFIIPLLPRENSSRAIVYFWKPPNFSTFFTSKNMVLTENLRLKLHFFKWTLADSGSRILRELKWIIQFHLWSKGLITDEEKNKSYFVISKEILMESESGELKGRHYSNET